MLRALLLFVFLAVGATAPAHAVVLVEESQLEAFLHTPSDLPCAVIGTTVNGKPSEPATMPYPVGDGHLTFTFADWPQADEDSLRQYLGWVMPVITQQMGAPAFPNQVTIRYDPELGYAAVYISSINEIRIKNRPSQNPGGVLSDLVHEIGHAYRDDWVIWASAFEEGLARGLEVRVMAAMPAFHRARYWNAGHRYYYDMVEDLENQPAVACPFGNFILRSLTLMRYELSGWVFWRLEEASGGTFFEAFHQEYFSRCRQQPTFPQNLVGIRQLMQYELPLVDGELASTWWGRYGVMNFAPPVGDDVFIRGDRVGVTAFYRTELGGEYPHQDILVEWTLRDRTGQLLGEGSLVTNSNGNAFPQLSLGGYEGKGTASFRVHFPGGVVERTGAYWLKPYLPATYDGFGLFGVADGPDGEITVTELGGLRYTTQVVNGEFMLPELDGVAGAFRIEWDGRQRVIRKDTAPYLVLLNEETTTPVAIADVPVPPAAFSVVCAPNPFTATVSFTVPHTFEAIAVYDVSGRRIRALKVRGATTIVWDGRDDQGRHAPSGVYFYRLSMGGQEVTGKVIKN